MMACDLAVKLLHRIWSLTSCKCYVDIIRGAPDDARAFPPALARKLAPQLRSPLKTHHAPPLGQLPARRDHDGLRGRARPTPHGLDGRHDVHPLHDAPEHDVLPVEPRGLGRAQEELGSVGVRAGVGHAQNAGTRVRELEVLVDELVPVDGLSSGACACFSIPEKREKTKRTTAADA